MPPEHLPVADMIQAHVERSGETDGAAAARIASEIDGEGISAVAMWRWRTGKDTPSPWYYRSLCHWLGVPLEQLRIAADDQQIERQRELVLKRRPRPETEEPPAPS